MFKQTKHCIKLGLGKLFCLLFHRRKGAMLDSFTLPYWDERLKLDVVDRLIRYSLYGPETKAKATTKTRAQA